MTGAGIPPNDPAGKPVVERKSGDGGNRTHENVPPIAAAYLAAFWLALSGAAVAHVPGCHSRKCDRRIHWKRARHWCHVHTWECRWHHVDPSLRVRLARLRWCESTNNYRAVNGQYTGAYQYAASTWARAGGYGAAMYAPPREQDVRTAWFYPSHTSEWECQA